MTCSSILLQSTICYYKTCNKHFSKDALPKPSQFSEGTRTSSFLYKYRKENSISKIFLLVSENYLSCLVNITESYTQPLQHLQYPFADSPPLYHCPPTCLTTIAKHVGAQSIASRRQQANKYTNLISQPLIELTHRVFALLD